MAADEKPSVYIETSVISYLTGRISRDIVVAGHQQVTQEWWYDALVRYTPYVSDVVLEEIAEGDPDAAQRRVSAVESFAVLELVEGVEELVAVYLETLKMPSLGQADAFHMALASMHAMDYLVSWNCRHIASAEVRRIVERINTARNIDSPTICTPEELLYGSGK